MFKVISGGQTGVDQAALEAAARCGFNTGGYIPNGFKTLDGPNPELARFNLTETYGGYKKRTWMNVWKADATIRIAEHWDSPGEKCTLSALINYEIPYTDFSRQHITEFFDQNVRALLYMLIKEQYDTINIAGNSEDTSPGIQKIAFDFLLIVFSRLKIHFEGR